jgi:hypothetical protein
MATYELIHIGKCGGSSVLKLLRNLNYNINHIHVSKPEFDINKKYIITIRNPVDRFISAFNWRYHKVITTKEQKNRYKGEKKLLEYYGNVNALAEDLYKPNGKLNIKLSSKRYYIHHLYEDINFYLGSFLNNCKKNNIRAVLLTETLDDDLKKKFGIPKKNVPHKLKNKIYSKYLSDLGLSNLKRWLRKDYKCINRLFKKKIITKNQYSILSK